MAGVALMLSTTAAAHPNKHPLSKGGLTLYEACWKVLGADCGRNLSEDGYRHKDGSVTDATKNQLHAWRDRIRAALAPPPAPEPVVSTYTPAPVATVSTGSSNSMVDPSCESGGDPTVYDPSGTYWGKYQFDQQTWDAYAPSGSWGSASESEQDAAAAAVPYDAWPNC